MFLNLFGSFDLFRTTDSIKLPNGTLGLSWLVNTLFEEPNNAAINIGDTCTLSFNRSFTTTTLWVYLRWIGAAGPVS